MTTESLHVQATEVAGKVWIAFYVGLIGVSCINKINVIYFDHCTISHSSVPATMQPLFEF